MITIEDIKTAIKDENKILTPDCELSYDAFKYLKKEAKITQRRALFVDGWQPRQKVHVVMVCSICGEEFRCELNKSSVVETSPRELNYGDTCEGILNRYTCGRKEVDDYLKTIKPHGVSLEKMQMCNACFRRINKQMNEEFKEFYENPLVWVNTHSSEKRSWQWDSIVKLYTYPVSFTNIPEGWKYCGVKFKKRYGFGLQTECAFDKDYENWHRIKDNTVVLQRNSTAKNIIQSILDSKPFDEQKPLGYRRMIEMTERMLDGIINNVDMSSLCEYVITEANKVLEITKTPPPPTKIFKFGKYKGYDVNRVIEIDRDYITWALEKIEGFVLGEEEMSHYLTGVWRRTDVEEVPNETTVATINEA